MLQIEIKLIHSGDGKITAPDSTLNSVQSLLAAFDVKLCLLAIHHLQITPNPFQPENEREFLTAPLFLIAVLESGIKMLYCDMHIFTIPILMLKADKLFVFPGHKIEEFKELIDTLRKI